MTMIHIPEKLVESFSHCEEFSEKYTTIMVFASSLPPIPDEKNAKELFNCQNVARFYHSVLDSKTVYFFGDSDSILIKGLMAIMFSCINSSSNYNITRSDISAIFKKLGIEKQYEESLPMGLGLIVDEVELVLQSLRENFVHDKDETRQLAIDN